MGSIARVRAVWCGDDRRTNEVVFHDEQAMFACILFVALVAESWFIMAISKAFKAFLSSINQSGNGDCYLVTDFFADVHGTTRIAPIRSGHTSYTFHPGPSTMEKITLPLPEWAQQVCREGYTVPSFKEHNEWMERMQAGLELERAWHDSQVSDCDLRPAE